MQKGIESKRELEKRMVSKMIALYCKKKHHTKGILMPDSVRTNVRSWRRKPSVPTVRYIATNRKCGRRSVRSCAFLVRG